MRDVVLTGTGRALSGHPIAIAGKTGTAEISGAPSHAWFIGFAPYGPATRRVAVAVLIENAGLWCHRRRTSGRRNHQRSRGPGVGEGA